MGMEIDLIFFILFLQKEPGYILAMEENGITVSTIHDEAIKVRIIYADEGFLRAYHLGRMGVETGMRFEIK